MCTGPLSGCNTNGITSLKALTGYENLLVLLTVPVLAPGLTMELFVDSTVQKYSVEYM